MIGRITAKADGAQCSIASPRLLLTARDKPLSQLFTLRRVFLELEIDLLTFHHSALCNRLARRPRKPLAANSSGAKMGGPYIRLCSGSFSPPGRRSTPRR